MTVQKHLGALVTTVLTVLTISSTAFGDSRFYCTNIDIRENVSSELRTYLRTPITQGSLGWCGHYTANDLLSQKLRTPLSATYTGMANAVYEKNAGVSIRDLFRRKNTGYNNGEHVRRVVRNVARGGKVCKASAITGSGRNFFDFVFDFGEFSTPGSYSVSNEDFFDQLRNAQQNRCGSDCNEIIMSSAKHFLGITSPEIVMKFIKDNPTLPVENVALSLMNYSCRNDFVGVSQNLEVRQVMRVASLNEGTLLNTIDNTLESGRLVGLTYDATYVVDPRAVKDKQHASVIVGRKSLNGECRYIVRNTWGGNCPYKDGVICEPETGSYLVTRKTLKKMAQGVTFIP